MRQLLAFLLVYGVFFAAPWLHAEQPVNFYNDIMPVLTKAGCNSGACHGAAVGRGGFRLSLYGGDPELDYESIALELEGRRVNLHEAARSLFYQKPTESLAHGGGYRLDPEEPGAQLLLRWIEQGTHKIQTSPLTHIRVVPDVALVSKVGETLSLSATAFFRDGTSRDVTPWTVFTAEDPSSVEIDPVTGECKLLRRGRHIVVARYLSEVVPLELIVPLADESPTSQSLTQHNFIDRHINQLLHTMGIPASAACDDATFIRRSTLDLTGRLPLTSAIDAFLNSTESDKREKLVQQLLGSPEYVEYWTLQLAQLFRIRPQPNSSQGAEAFHEWLQAQLAKDLPYDQLARSLLLATGKFDDYGPANFFRISGGPRERAEFVSELFMGNRLRCANCHNHPLDRWTQDDYHGLAAILAKLELANGEAALKSQGSVIHPKTGEDAIPRIPGDRFLRNGDGREALADWLTDRENPYFAKAIVNRLWKALMGRGLVEPVDDLRATNPATHPALLDALAQDFIDSQYSLRHTLEQIAQSAAYARQAEPLLAPDDRYYSHAIRKPLAPEVLADAISDVLDIPDRFGEEPAGTRAVSLFNPLTKSATLDALGRCDREESCEATSASVGGLPLKLHLMNGALLNDRISREDGRLHRALLAGQSGLAIVEDFYIHALCRNPNESERAYWRNQLSLIDNPQEQEELLQDFVWSLLTCKEFVNNH